MNLISPTVPLGNALSWMNNLRNSSSSSWRELHRQSQVYWLILVVHFAVQCWDACCVWGVRSVLPVQCRGRLPETHVWKPFWHSSASWCDQHWPWPIFIIPILSFLATAFQSIQVSFKGCALVLPNFPDTERWQIENVKGAPGDLHSPPLSLLSVVPTTVREVSWMYSSTNFYNIDGAAYFLVMK